MSPPAHVVHAALSVSQGQHTDTLWCSFCLHSVDEDCVSSFPLRNRFDSWGRAEIDKLCSSMRCGAAFRTETTTTTTTDLHLEYVEFFSYKKAIKHLSTLPIWVAEIVSYLVTAQFQDIDWALYHHTSCHNLSYLLPTNVYLNTFPLTGKVFSSSYLVFTYMFFLDQGEWALIKTSLSCPLITFPIDPWNSFSQHIQSWPGRKLDGPSVGCTVILRGVVT